MRWATLHAEFWGVSSRYIGKATSLNIGTPAEIQYYFVTAYDSANHESGASKVVVFIRVGSPPPPPTQGGLRTNSLS